MKSEKMTKKKAFAILEIYDPDPTKEFIKKQYRLMALKYHPDKNKSENASADFLRIHSAYEYLTDSHTEKTEDESESVEYMNILQQFLNQIFCEENNKRIILEIIRKVIMACETKSLELLKNISKPILTKVYEIIQNYTEVLHFTEDFIEKVGEILKNKIEKDEYIIMNPLLEDLFNANIYKLSVDDSTFLVPLWHHELVFDNSGSDLIVECFPILPENIRIDENNNIHVSVVYDIHEIWDLSFVAFSIGNQMFSFPKEQLHMKTSQIRILGNQGIPMINLENVYDIEKKSDIYLYIEINSSSS